MCLEWVEVHLFTCLTSTSYIPTVLPIGRLCLSPISMMFVKIMLAVCKLVGMVI